MSDAVNDTQKKIAIFTLLREIKAYGIMGLKIPLSSMYQKKKSIAKKGIILHFLLIAFFYYHFFSLIL